MSDRIEVGQWRGGWLVLAPSPYGPDEWIVALSTGTALMSTATLVDRDITEPAEWAYDPNRVEVGQWRLNEDGLLRLVVQADGDIRVMVPWCEVAGKVAEWPICDPPEWWAAVVEAGR